MWVGDTGIKASYMYEVMWTSVSDFFFFFFHSVHQSYVDATTERKFFISVSCFPTTGCHSNNQVCESSLYLINSRLALHHFSTSHASNQYWLWTLLQITSKLLTEKLRKCKNSFHAHWLQQQPPEQQQQCQR